MTSTQTEPRTAPVESALADTSQEQLLAPLKIDAATADLLFRAARTTNAFSEEPVADEEIHAAYDLTRWGPTAMNISPLRYLIVRSPQARERLVQHMAEGNQAKTLTAPLTVVVAADPNFHEQMKVLAPHRAEFAQNLAAAPEQRTAMARMNALIQVGFFITGLRAAGLHTGPMGGFDAAAIDSEFFSESQWQTLLVLNVGHPAAQGAHHPRAARLTPSAASQTV